MAATTMGRLLLFARRAAGTIALLAGPMAAQPVGHPRFGIETPMRDGVRLSANLWLPDSVGKFPTILLRTPYDKTPQFRRYSLDYFVRAGYAVMIQDTRGRGDSEGTFDHFFPEGPDGYDTIEWIARQPWSNGKVAMNGGSYLGTVQYLAARERPPHLSCIAPFAALGRHFDEAPYIGGAFALEWALTWIPSVSGRVSQSELADAVDYRRLFAQRPLVRLDTLLGRPMRFYQEALAHPTMDAWWKRVQFEAADFEKIDVPVLAVTGWFDGDQVGSFFYWNGMQRRASPTNPHWLLVGPWNHGQTYLGGAMNIGALAFDSSSIVPIRDVMREFYDWCLKGERPSYDAPRVRVYVTGANRWRTGDRYPLPGVRDSALYLASEGGANGLEGNGALAWSPSPRARPDTFTYDPRRPVPVASFGEDHRAIEARPDVLVYTTPPFTQPLEVIGNVRLVLHASSDGPDTDFTAKLLDVYPDGRAIKLGAAPVSVLRARFREGYEREVPLRPHEPTQLTIDMGDVGHEFAPGHRLRIEVSSSAFPFIAPNQNTGNPVATDTVVRVARQTVYHDRGRPSRLVLPVLGAGQGRAR